MKYKMIVTDLDRTLLRGDGFISNYTMEMLNKVQEHGIKLVFATARPIRDVKKIGMGIRFDSCIYHNGAVVQYEKNIVSHKGINNSFNIVKKMIKANPDLKIGVEACDTLYANFKLDHFWPNTAYVYTNDFEECKNKTTEKIIMLKKDIGESNIYENMDENLYLQISEDSLAMVLNKEARKVNGVKMIAEMYGIGLEEVIAFGDDYNDIEILRNCGLGIAVSNAYEDVKKNADDICKSNEVDGVARYINERIFNI